MKLFHFNEKHFENLYYSLADELVTVIDETARILDIYGAKEYIAKSESHFFLSTYLYYLYFIESTLMYKYSPKHIEKIQRIISYFLAGISNQLNIEDLKFFASFYQKLVKDIRTATIKHSEKGLDPFFINAEDYLRCTFGDPNNPENFKFGSNVQFAIAQLMKNFVYKISLD